MIKFVKSLVPVSKIILETNSFDPHKLKEPEVCGIKYQQGKQEGFENVKAYVLARDGYKCYFNSRCSSVLHVHHIILRSKGGSDAPDNLITLCERHHNRVHKGKEKLLEVKHKQLKSATAMDVIRTGIKKSLNEFEETFGYLTKLKREQIGLEKSHASDAFLIAGGVSQKRTNVIKMRFKRKNNRALQLNRKGFAPSIRKERYNIQPYDLVIYEGKQYRAVGVQNRGEYVKITDGKDMLVKKESKIKPLYHEKTLMIA